MKQRREGGFLIAKIHQLAGRILARKLKKCGVDEINPAQGRILFALWQSNDISIQELAKKTSLGKSTLTSMLDRLEEAGHVTRVPSKEDRRKILIKLTDKNRALRDVYAQVSNDMTELFYAGFNGMEITQFEENLRRILNNLEHSEQ
ncbi:MAG: MarR family transcriptional [Geobacteraceae bacterium]|nr:MAG: MarR family transcriptional [Geobacteraceae bacterium]